MKISAIIFDMDGTIIKSENVWAECFVQVLKNLGIEKDYPVHFSGASIKANWQIFQKEFSINKNLDELEVLTYNEFEKHIAELEIYEGFWDLADILKDQGYQLALATSTRWETVDKIFQHLELGDLFDSITTGEEVANPKPDPAIFILAADKLGIEPEDILVFEDSNAGVVAAKGAGMKVIAIDPTGEREDLDDADLVVDSLSKIKPKTIDAL